MEGRQPDMIVQQGDVVFLRFPFSDGSESKVRPAVVVQCDADNERLDSTIVVLITGNTKLVGREPGHVLIDIATSGGRQSGLRYNSAINCHAVFTLHTNQIREVIGKLPEALMMDLDDQRQRAMDLTGAEQ
jgi:mRNA interferase MazF